MRRCMGHEMANASMGPRLFSRGNRIQCGGCEQSMTPEEIIDMAERFDDHEGAKEIMGWLLEHIDSQDKEIKRLKDNHCKDCCCARSWEALGITEYTGRSIPEEIIRLREQVIKNRDIATDLQYICDDQDEEIKRLEEALVEERARWMYPYSMPRWETLQEGDHHVLTLGGIEDRYGKNIFMSPAPLRELPNQFLHCLISRADCMRLLIVFYYFVRRI